ncbi:hypothetical protein QA648_04540 [Rhizobium sp. CB3171]|uniref:hypothetical protein n=1 Tax=Rhizobium sp. CB3171 TaxID=3039157 RepID=UPI0024B10603|nr:hypothetical protein [Rhizobium sp. CB3171]WFU03050.1 hypothetical protein QA648_04540 [Rhizobium sp. CB3171]
MSVKVMIARAQLGSALDIFIRDRDPIAVHALACGGSEIIEGLAEQADIPTLSTHILKTFPDTDYRKLKHLRNQFWNAIKHFYQRDGKTTRDDEALMAEFTDAANDAVLFMGWLDYLLLTKRLPVEAQVFQIWWYATNPKHMSPNADPTAWQSLFPGIENESRQEQKRRLRRAVEKWQKNREILRDPRTEPGALCARAAYPATTART